MSGPKWIRRDVVILTHQKLLVDHGGPDGIRDEGILDSALARPRNMLAYEPDATIFQLTAAYAYGLAKDHPFVDGYKRVALNISVGFLRVNGLHLNVSEVEAASVFLDLAAGDISEEEVAAWFEGSCQIL